MKLKDTTKHPRTPLSCSVCGAVHGNLSQYQGGYVCDDCAEENRVGSSTTAKALRAQQKSNRAAQKLIIREEGEASASEQLEFVKTAGQLLAVDTLSTQVDCIPLAGGEVEAFGDVHHPKMLIHFEN